MRMDLKFALPILLLLLAPGGAAAHAMLDRAEPRVGSTVHAPPHEVSLWFSQNIEGATSTTTVTDAGGRRVDAGKPAISGNVMRVPLQGVGAGTYRVRWHVLSVDTHTTQGSFTFRVGE